MISHSDYDEIGTGFNEEVSRQLDRGMRQMSAVFSRIQQVVVAHIADDDPNRQTQVMEVSTVISVSDEIAESGQRRPFQIEVVKASEELIREWSKQFYANVDATCSSNGMTIDAAGRPLSIELICEALEKLDIDFDENGKAILPSLIVHPSNMEALRDMLSDPEAMASIEEVLLRKRREKGLG